MADSDLEALRAERLAQMQQQNGPQNKEEEEDRQNQAEQMKNQILAQILDQQARARLNTLMIAKPEKGRAVESLLVNMARMGQLRSKIGEEELIGLLEKVNERNQKNSTTVKFDRRRANFDEEDEDDFDL